MYRVLGRDFGMKPWEVDRLTPEQAVMLLKSDRPAVILPPGATLVPGTTNIVRCNSMAEAMALSASIKARQREEQEANA